jgi:transposase-like protein
VNTTATEPTKGRRRRRNHSAAFKAQVVASCRQTGVSIAAVAMGNAVNANLLRRWIIEAEQHPDTASLPGVQVATQAPSFVAVALSAPVAPQDIRIELRRGQTTINVAWPSNAAADCAAWMRELLR